MGYNRDDLPTMTHKNPREWSLDRIAVILTVIIQLIVGGAFLLSWSDKVDNMTLQLSDVKTKVEQIQSDVAVLKVQVENVDNELDVERRERERLEDRRRSQLKLKREDD